MHSIYCTVFTENLQEYRGQLDRFPKLSHKSVLESLLKKKFNVNKKLKHFLCCSLSKNPPRETL